MVSAQRSPRPDEGFAMGGGVCGAAPRVHEQVVTLPGGEPGVVAAGAAKGGKEFLSDGYEDVLEMVA